MSGQSVIPLGDRGDGFLVVQPVEKVPDGRHRVLRASSQLARQLTEVLSETGGHVVDPSLVRIINNAGASVPYDRLTAAVSGAGRRGFIRDGKSIVENVRLVPANSSLSAARQLGGRLLTGGVTVAVDVIAQEQQTRLLERIAKTTELVHEHLHHELEARLRACLESMDDAAAVMLDGQRPGAATGFDSALHDSRQLFHHALQDLEKLTTAQRRITKHPTVAVGRLTEDFPGIDEVAGEFWRKVSFVRRALALRSRALNLQASIHPVSELEDVSHLGQLLQSRLAEVETLQDHFDDLLDWVGALEVDVDEMIMIPTFWSGRTALKIQRYAMNLGREVLSDATHARQIEGVRVNATSTEITAVRAINGDLHIPL